MVRHRGEKFVPRDEVIVDCQFPIGDFRRPQNWEIGDGLSAGNLNKMGNRQSAIGNDYNIRHARLH